MKKPGLNESLRALGITAQHINECCLPSYTEAKDLVEAGVDMFDRPARMTAATFSAWCAMKEAAHLDGIDLKLVSAFRSVDYQCEVIARKLAEGRTIDEILCVNAIPGHSEHHTGRALDLHAGEEEPLTPGFEQHPAFEWLTRHAGSFGFSLSYPRDNADGIDYEPWHWCYQDRDTDPGPASGHRA